MANKVTVTPLHDRVIVKPAAAEEKTAGGIIIPDTAKEKPQRGTVIAAGPGKKDEPVTVKEGDTVCTANTPAPKSLSKEKISSSCVKATFSQLFNLPLLLAIGFKPISIFILLLA